jgi:hypothetical protein
MENYKNTFVVKYSFHCLRYAYTLIFCYLLYAVYVETTYFPHNYETV